MSAPAQQRQTLVDAAATETLGGQLAAVAVQHERCTIHLRGDLGTGKTTLVRGFLRALGHTGAVKSPTYTILEPYTLADRAVIHCDLYRLSDPEELAYIGLDDMLGEGTIVLLEWPERGGELTPPPDLDILLQYAESGRACNLRAYTATGQALLAALVR